MRELDEEQRLIRRYLLGDLQEATREAVEQRMITDRDYLDNVKMVERDLMDEYVSGVLTGGDRVKFKSSLLSTPRQIPKLRFARALAKYAEIVAAANSPPVTETASKPDFWKRVVPSPLRQWSKWAIGILAAATVVAVIAVVVVIRITEHNEIRAALEREVTDLNSQWSQSPAGSQAFVVGPLNPGLFRDSGGMPKVAIPDTAAVAQIQLRLVMSEASTYRIQFETIEGDEILALSDLQPKTVDGHRVVVLYLPSRLLPPGDYQLVLSALKSNNEFEYIDRYVFRVTQSSASLSHDTEPPSLQEDTA